MIFVCPKCGKKIELSVEALIASEYHAVCPQCLTRLQIVGDTAIIPVDIPAVPKHEPVQPPVPQLRESTVEKKPVQAATPAQPAIPIPPVQPKQQPLPPKYPSSPQPQPYYSQPYYPTGNSQPYYPTSSSQPYYQQPQTQQPAKKEKYSCTCTGCLVWGLILIGILFLLAHM